VAGRFIPQHPGAPATPDSSELREVMGLRFWDADLARVARYIVGKAVAAERLQVYFVNAHCVNVAARDRDYAQLLRESPFLFADGAGMALAARLAGIALNHNVNGTDLFPQLCAAAAAAGVPVAFLGARRKVAAACAARMEQQHPGLRVAWVADGYLAADEEDRQLGQLNASGAKILFVAKGVPAQEHWIAAHAGRLAAPVVLGVGALFDFYSGTVPRAPAYIRKLRMEWCYRLLREPRRLFARYVLGNPEFVARALLWRLQHR
jgi:N-acetylglucosaminyldiphosphoundecaprenol N-acetyl-beta-D-mannosaminyltransferase